MVENWRPDSNERTSLNNNNNGNGMNKEHLAAIKSNLLSPTEVTFCDISSSKNSINSKSRRDYDGDSIISSVTTHPKKNYKIPDGGWGWMVVLASFAISLIIDGASFSFGLLYTQFLYFFKESESKTSWIGSLFLAVPLMSGPILSNLVDTYGCRKMTMIGGLIAGLGFTLAAFSNSVEQLYITFGVITGFGVGFGYVTVVVSVCLWFDKRRTFATGIGASGTGVGTFVYAPLTQWLIEYYGWRGTVLILAGTMFNVMVFGALMRDPDWMIEENKLDSRSQSVQTFSNSSVGLDEIKRLLDAGVKNEDVLDTLVTTYNTEANQQIACDNAVHEKKYQSLLHLPTYITSPEFEQPHGSRRSLRPKKNFENDGSDLFVNYPTAPNKELDEQENTNLASMETLSPSETQSIGHTAHSSTTGLNQRRYSLNDSKPIDESANMKQNHTGSLNAIVENELMPLSKTKVVPIIVAANQQKQRESVRHRRVKNFDEKTFKQNLALKNSHYFQNMRVHRNSIHYRGAMLNTHRYRLKASSCPNIYRNSMTTIALENEDKWYDNFIDLIKSIFDFSLFLDIKFAFFMVSTLALFTWFIVPYFYLNAYLIAQKQYKYSDEDAAMLISLIGISQTIGMIVLGWVGDQPKVNVPKLYGVCLLFCGISIGLIPILSFSVPLLMVLCAIFGVTFASSFSFTPVILVSLIDLEDFTCAYGLVLLVQGIGNLIGPPLASAVFTFTDQWDESFYAGGIFIFLSGLLVFVTGVLQTRDRNKLASKETDVELSTTS